MSDPKRVKRDKSWRKIQDGDLLGFCVWKGSRCFLLEINNCRKEPTEATMIAIVRKQSVSLAPLRIGIR